jgi:fermentation-respiration switch protein FrsA (DUF1100 family)
MQSAFTSTFRVLTRITILPIDKFRNYRDIQRVHCPVLIMHGTADGVVPFWHGAELYALAHEPKSRLWIDGAGHNDLEEVAGPRYAKALHAFAVSLEKRTNSSTSEGHVGRSDALLITHWRKSGQNIYAKGGF